MSGESDWLSSFSATEDEIEPDQDPLPKSYSGYDLSEEEVYDEPCEGEYTEAEYGSEELPQRDSPVRQCTLLRYKTYRSMEWHENVEEPEGNSKDWSDMQADDEVEPVHDQMGVEPPHGHSHPNH